jgi:hypothetical protein
MAQQEKLQALWEDVRKTLRGGDTVNRALWEAADAAVPLTVEEGALIIGFDPADMRHSSYLETPTNQSRIQEILQARTGKRFELRCIEGDTLEAWEHLKKRQQQREERAKAEFARQRAQSEAAETWENVALELQNLFATTERRGEAKIQAQMLVHALPMVHRTEKKAREQNPNADRLHDQALNRMFSRIATVCGMPESTVALEYLRYRSAHRDDD